MTRPGSTVYAELPDLINGYEQAVYDVKFVKPMAATNLMPNPSFELNTTGTVRTSTLQNETFTRVSTEQRYGTYCLMITGTGANNEGVFNGQCSTVAGVSYVASLYIKGLPGRSYNAAITTVLGSVLSSTLTFIATGKWQRISIRYTETSTSTDRGVRVRQGFTSTTPWYVDGFQFETDRLTTYLDGSMTGFVRNQMAYYWNGAEHASTSTRIQSTRSGGIEYDLKDFGFKVMAILGLGWNGFNNLSTDNAFLGGAIYERSIARATKFDIVGAFFGDSPQEIMRNKSDLLAILQYDAAFVHQPLLMNVRMEDNCGNFISEPMSVECLFADGLFGNRDNYNQERTSLSFEIFGPNTGRLDAEHGTVLDFNDPFTANYVAARINGEWQAMATTFDNGINQIIPDVARGRIYYVGNFTTPANFVCYWNIATQAFVAMGTGANNFVWTGAVAANGDLYIGGQFTSVNGVASDGFARWNYATSTWTQFTNGTPGDTFRSIVIDNTGMVYAAGSFINWNGDAAQDYIFRYNGVTFSACGVSPFAAADFPSRSQALSMGPGNVLYAASSDAGPVARLRKFNGTTWTTVLTGVGGDFSTMLWASDGSLYGGGDLTSMDGVTIAGVFRWNGTVVEPLGSGVNSSVYYAIELAPNTILYMGVFFVAGGISLPDRMAVWNGSTWYTLDIDLSGAASLHSATKLNNDDLYIGGGWNGIAESSGTVLYDNPGSADSYPIFRITGPLVLYRIQNLTTGDLLLFNLTLLASEVAILDFTQSRVSFSSNFRPNLLSTILPGSSYNFRLHRGVNTLIAFGTTSSGATFIDMRHKPAYASLDDTLYR